MWLRIRDWWWARQRAADLQMLWPACKAQTPSIEEAHQIFIVHAWRAPCWREYYGDPEALTQAVWQLS